MSSDLLATSYGPSFYHLSWNSWHARVSTVFGLIDCATFCRQADEGGWDGSGCSASLALQILAFSFHRSMNSIWNSPNIAE